VKIARNFANTIAFTGSVAPAIPAKIQPAVKHLLIVIVDAKCLIDPFSLK